MKDVVNLTSGTFWSGLGLVGFGIYLTVSGQTEDGVGKIMEGLGLIFLRRAIGQARY